MPAFSISNPFTSNFVKVKFSWDIVTVKRFCFLIALMLGVGFNKNRNGPLKLSQEIFEFYFANKESQKEGEVVFIIAKTYTSLIIHTRLPMP